ncbi:hypothetical protein [Actinacidiphila paucisporea]|uniref:PLL-like beta propeller domain-containing protein n=1 Tax=Actinacidiphila paucisporea TaxID=310782 RepID=A0A1M7MF71_9ACTN|nr:hypothetical protein [Actinacidiphila paucisporea]SHM89532.1 hypothetical protein SAMN05216499_11619 [Actinacidiphila paucisporea]
MSTTTGFTRRGPGRHHTTNPVVFPAGDKGRLEVFARGSDNSLWCDYQTKPNGGTGDWVWKTLNGRITSEPAVFRNADDRMEVAVADINRRGAVTYSRAHHRAPGPANRAGGPPRAAAPSAIPPSSGPRTAGW